MSTTANATESNRPRPGFGIDPDDAFDQLVFRDRTICSRCFQQIRRYDTFRPDADGSVSKYAPKERCIRAFDGEKGYKVEEFDEYGYRPRASDQ